MQDNQNQLSVGMKIAIICSQCRHGMICQLAAIGGNLKKRIVELALMMEQCCWDEVLKKLFKFQIKH